MVLNSGALVRGRVRLERVRSVLILSVSLVQVARTKSPVPVANSAHYTGWWVGHGQGRVLAGLIGLHTLTDPLLAWVDPSPSLSEINSVELEFQGVEGTFLTSCPVPALVPGDSCAGDQDCDHLAMTSCQPGEAGGAGLYTSQCQVQCWALSTLPPVSCWLPAYPIPRPLCAGAWLLRPHRGHTGHLPPIPVSSVAL